MKKKPTPKDTTANKLARQILALLKKQRETFIRLRDGTMCVTDPLRYRQYEKESHQLQLRIGTDTLRRLKKDPAFVAYEKKRYEKTSK